MLFLEGRGARAQILGCRRDRLPVHIYYGIVVRDKYKSAPSKSIFTRRMGIMSINSHIGL